MLNKTMTEALARVCDGGVPAWDNFKGKDNACHVDTWLMLMISAVVDDTSRQPEYINRFNNDEGTQ